METTSLTAEDEALVETVMATNRGAFDPDFFDGGHVVAAGVRAADGAVYDGVSLPTAVGRASVCGEPVAVGSAVADGHRHDGIETCVAVSYPLPAHDATEQRVVPPCGVCRELLIDCNPEMRVVVPDGDGLGVARAADLLPVRTW